jgi:hypothetical protein
VVLKTINIANLNFKLDSFMLSSNTVINAVNVIMANTHTNIAANSFVKTMTSVANTKLILANTNTFIATKAATATVNSQLANTNAFIKQKMAVSNTNTLVNAVYANTNAFIKQKISVANSKIWLANTNAYINSKLDVANSKSILANTNAFIKQKIAVSNTNALINASYANTNAFIKQKISVANSNLRLANTNTYIGTKANTSMIVSAASSTEIRATANTTAKSIGVGNYMLALKPINVTDQVAIFINYSAGINFDLSIAGDRFLRANNFINQVGKTGRIKVTESGGARKLNIANTPYVTVSATDFVLAAGSGKQHVIYYEILSNTQILLSAVQSIG